MIDEKFAKIVKTITGEVVAVRRPPDLDALKTRLQDVLDKGIKSLAVVLKHSALYPDHETQVGELASSLGFTQVSLSSIVMPMVKISIATYRRTGDFVPYEEQERFQEVRKFTFGGLSVGDGFAVTV